MARVYISSTYDDLKDYRLAARSAVLGLDCHAVGMEDYPADPSPSIERCLRDVRSCQFYVGLFAWGYGSLVPGREKSFTHLEYEEAFHMGLPCLIFLLHPSASWPENRRDADPKNILALRSFLQRNHTTKSFDSPQKLETAVTQAMAFLLRPLAQIQVPGILPYLGNRSVQRDELAQALHVHRARRPRRPFIGFVHGSEDEAHDRFIDRLQQIILPDLLETALVKLERLPWPDTEGPVDKRWQGLRQNLAETLTGRNEAEVEELAVKVASMRAPLLLSTSLSSREWQPDQAELVRRWLKFWSEWPDLPPGQTLLLFLASKYENPENSEASGWWRKISRRKRSAMRNGELRAFVGSIGGLSLEGVSMAVLSELHGIRESEVEELIEREIRAFVTKASGGRLDPVAVADHLKEWSSKFFDRWEAIADSPRAPMQLVARELRKRLEECVKEGA